MTNPFSTLLKKLSIRYRKWTYRWRMGPDFMIIGAQKAGTSALFNYLSKHPQVFMATAKELHFFDLNYEKGDPYYLKHFMTKAAVAQQREKRNFLQGEASPYYLFHPHVPQRVLQYNPGMKIIILLRDPAQRAISHYKHNVRAKREPLSFEEAIDNEEARIGEETKRLTLDPRYHSYAHRHYSYRARGLYQEQIERWLAVFPEQQVLVLPSQALKTERLVTLAKVCQFLEIDEDLLQSADVEQEFNLGADIEVTLSPALEMRLNQFFEASNRYVFEKFAIDFINTRSEITRK